MTRFVFQCARVLFVLLVSLRPVMASAQQSSPHRTELGGDVLWLTGVTFNDVNANETAFGGATRVVFRTSTKLEQAVCPEAKVLVGLTSTIDAEAAVAFGRTRLSTSITSDPEAASTTVSTPLTLYLLQGGVSAHPARWQRGRAAPFASGGIGYLRQLHDGHALVQSGKSWYVGGGLRYRLKDDTARGLNSAALRLELRATILPGGATLPKPRPPTPKTSSASATSTRPGSLRMPSSSKRDIVPRVAPFSRRFSSASAAARS